MNIPLEQYRQAADYIRAHLTGQPEVCLVLGSGLGRLADEVEDAVRIPYADIPGFPRSTVASHAGMMLCGRLCGREVIVMAGRFHYYEGYDMETAAFYVRVMHLLGVRRLLLTNAAGGVNPDFRVGDFMLIADHIKLCAESPARGAEEPAFGPRFFDMTRTYTPALLTLARTCAQTLGQPLREGVYFFMAGPQFETPAEIRAARLLGADAAGMSTVPEVIAANHCGMQVLGFSLCANMAAGILDQPLSEQEVLDAAAAAAEKFSALVRGCLREM